MDIVFGSTIRATNKLRSISKWMTFGLPRLLSESRRSLQKAKVIHIG
jgi:hypothetical protein